MNIILNILCVICATQVLSIYAQDFYYDEKGKTYVIDSWGNRIYSGSKRPYVVPKQRDADQKILNFAMEFFKKIESDGQNFVAAPLSPQILLSCLAAQSKNATRDQIVAATGYSSSEELEKLTYEMQREPSDRELKIGNGFFVDQSKYRNIKKSFWDDGGHFDDDERYDHRRRHSNRDHNRDFLRRYGPDYGREFGEDYERNYERDYEKRRRRETRQVDVVRMDFGDIKSAKETYRKWVSEKTKGVLKKVDTDFDQDTAILLASTIYFKGQWLFNFNASEKEDFYLNKNNPVKVDVMKIRKKFHSGTFDNIKARWAAIPYNSSESMIIIMPNEDQDLNNVIDDISGSDIKEIIDVINGPSTSNYLNVALPKFTLKSTIQLKEPLQKMNITEIFTPASTLSIFKDEVPLKIGSALQQSYLEVNEQGSVGASTTTFSAIALTVQQEVKNADFFVDRPFLALIIDRKYSVPYFIAKIFDPRN